ncbi:M23 family metallopeptidase [Candidatus Roizmanbacteria bacterium]|nr:M23 family metallopeptidase [Candidatus Roizmanbacteria bacterium]
MGVSLKRVFRSYNGRHFVSRWARKLFERDSIYAHIGYYLACGFIMVSLFEPAVATVSAQQELVTLAPTTISPESEPPVKTQTTLAWPVSYPTITQGYRFGHWGLDIQDSVSKDIHPVDSGVVAEINSWNWGYGKHVRIQHPHGRSSLYAHMSSISVEVGQEVTRETIIGQMGRTGWASGIHLHLEIYQDGAALNPLAVLPENDHLAIRPYDPNAHDAAVVASGSAIVTADASQ